MENGYEILEIYEVHHFDADNRSDTLMRGYMGSFLRLKQESEGWKKLGASCEEPSEEEKTEVAQRIYDSNGGIGLVRINKVKKNPVLRHVSKIFLNCLWGKFCQRQKADFYSELTSYKDYEALLGMEEMKNMSFRQMEKGKWRIKYSKPTEICNPNKRYNIYLAAAVTAQARCYLHRQMIKIGPERILYCDTDSIIFIYPTDASELAGIGLGKWTDEYPTKRVSEFMAIAPKCYMLSFGEETSVMKAKGCVMSVVNQKELDQNRVKQLIQAFCVQKTFETVQLNNFAIYSNSTDINYKYGTMFTRYNKKAIRCVLNKRQLITEYSLDSQIGRDIDRVTLYPEGFIFESPWTDQRVFPSEFLSDLL